MARLKAEYVRGLLAVYLVTDTACLQGLTLPQAAEQALKGGVTLVQYRAKNTDGGRMYREALELKALCDAYGVPLIINDRVDIALAVGAAGVHVGQSDMPCAAVRKLVPESFIVGVSAHSAAEALQAERDGADYLGCGAVFGSSTKNDASYLGLAGLAAVRAGTELPLVGIGGVTLANFSQVLRQGADGAALVSGLLGEADIAAAAAAFRRLHREQARQRLTNS